MCNDYEAHINYAEYKAMMAALDLSVPERQGQLDLPVAGDIRINDQAAVIRAAGNGIELAPMNFGLPPAGRGPIFNFRSEGRHFSQSNRCLIPASAFFEFTGKKYPKTKHRFSMTDAPFMAIAGIWRAGADGRAAFTMLTTEPGPDVARYHNRQVVVLNSEDWPAWLYLTRPERELLRPSTAGSLSVETVRQGAV